MNKLIYNNYVFTDEDIISGSIHISNAMVCESLEADTLEAELLTATDEPTAFITALNKEFYTVDNEQFFVKPNYMNLTEYTYGSPIEYYYDDKLVGRFYLQSVQRIGKQRYKLTCTSIVGMLIYQQHMGGIYKGETVGSVIESIMGTGNYTIDENVASINVYGHLPIASARDNLQQVLFSVGASILKDENQNLRICYNQPDEALAISDDRLFLGGGVNYLTPATKVAVTEHDYYESLTVDDSMLYDNTTGITADHLLITFQNPCHSIHSDTLTIEQSGANFAIVSGVGILYGKEYIHTTRTVEISTGIEAVEPNEVTVKDATLVSSVNSVYVAKRVANYYSATYEIDASLVAGDESTGNLIEFTDPFEEKSQGYIREIDYTMSGVLKGNTKIIANWKPKYVGNAFTNYIIVTQEDLVNGQWHVPEELVGKKVLLVLFGGGAGGNGGYDGGAGGSSTETIYWLPNVGYTYFTFAAGGAGGIGGEGGKAGNILKADIEELASEYNVNFGVGGIGGDPNGGEGTLGTHSVFGNYDTDNGAPFVGNYINLIDGSIYAANGETGLKGGNGGDAGVKFDPTDHYNNGRNGNKGADVSPFIGGNGTNYTTGDGYYYATFSGSSGGGAAYGNNGGDAVQSDVTGGQFVSSGRAGNGANAVAHPKSTLGSGGHGGNGGGGSGARGYGHRQRNSSHQYRQADAGTVGLGSRGSDGGDGFALIYYGEE